MFPEGRYLPQKEDPVPLFLNPEEPLQGQGLVEWPQGRENGAPVPLPPHPLGALNLRREAQLGCLYDRAYVWGLFFFLLDTQGSQEKSHGSDIWALRIGLRASYKILCTS